MKNVKFRLFLSSVLFITLMGFFSPVAGVLNASLGFGISVVEALIALILLLLFRPAKTY